MNFRNSTYAFLGSLQSALGEGQRLYVRGSEILELRNRVTVIEHPLERCIIIPNRRNNIFATIAETMWVLAGRNDVSFLSHYLPRAPEFSDDGLTWRGGYGPRLRNWRGVDQIGECLAMLRNEPSSRRAVISLFDPSADFLASKDIPCNNWIHWLIRDDCLHMNVALRSNDIMWGFSGINSFEWSVLQELMASWLGVAIGELTFFASSLHLYTQHEQRAHLMLRRFPGITCYDYGLTSPRFATPWDDFDQQLQVWFELEGRIRVDPESPDGILHEISDPLLRHFLDLLRVYNGAQHGWQVSDIDERLGLMPETDLTAAAYEYFHRNRALQPERIPHPLIAQYFDRYSTDSFNNLTVDSSLRQAIIQLHDRKTAAYGASWKRRGEQVSVLANIARKVDRLEQWQVRASDSSDETVYDTVIDLLVYCIKYQTYLADLDEAVASDLFGPAALTLAHPFSDGLEAFDYLIQLYDVGGLAETPDITGSITSILSSFAALERCFPPESPPSPTSARLDRVQELTRATVLLLGSLGQEYPTLYARFISSFLQKG